jgi:hypothetical protein
VVGFSLAALVVATLLVEKNTLALILTGSLYGYLFLMETDQAQEIYFI